MMEDRNLTSATRTDRELTSVLAECLSRLEEDGVSIDACVAPHPEWADALKSLLTLAEKMIQHPQPVQRRAPCQAGIRRLLGQAARRYGQHASTRK